MSLFAWATPERRCSVNRILPLIPNEIYIHIFEYIAPPTGRLTPEELRIFTSLSYVCRFFANHCLPRIFEFVEFSGSIFGGGIPRVRDDGAYIPSREVTLCAQITARQPLALSLAKRARICHFTDWQLDETGPGSWAVRLFAQHYLDGVAHMQNIRELKFSDSFVDEEHWRVIATLRSLEELSFDFCRFLRGPAEGKVEVSRLEVIRCDWPRQLVRAIDPRRLRTLATDSMSFDQVGWLPRSALTKLHLYITGQVDGVLTQVHQSVQELCLSIVCLELSPKETRNMVRHTFDNFAWKSLPLLRSLTLQIFHKQSNPPESLLSFVLDCITPLADIQSFTLSDHLPVLKVSPGEIRRILHSGLGPSSSLTYADIYGKAFRLVDRQWSEVPRTV